MTAPLLVSRADVRAFLLRATGLDGFQTLSTVADAVQTLGFVQEDSINVCGRMHDLVLMNRVCNYRAADLSRFLYNESPRRAFEYYLPNLCVLPVSDYRYFLPAMRARREADGRYGRLTPEEEAAATVLLSAIDTGGAIFLRDTRALGDAHGHTVSGWGTKTRLLSFVADKLFWQGRLGIARRDGFTRAFDRAENLFPSDVLNAPIPSDVEATRYLTLKKLHVRRLFRLSAADKSALGEHETVPLLIEGDPKPWYILTDDLPFLTDARPVAPTLALLAPLDPVVYDRARTRFLFDFDYTWEVYVPETKRKWGYYVLPVLLGDRLVGRIEPRVDKKTGTVRVVSQGWEPGFDADEIADALAERLAGLATL